LYQIRESVSGVSLDEEAANLVKYQRSYQAAAKVVSVFDGLIQDVLQMVR
ncbi:MAG: flagellar basal body rod C-terminal domain-containing protein, partial [Fimbriimonadales bacterium]